MNVFSFLIVDASHFTWLSGGGQVLVYDKQ